MDSVADRLDLQPLHDRVIIRRKDTPAALGKIIIPENSKEMEPTEGTVVAVGNECKQLMEGDVVYFGRYSGFSFERNGGKFVFCNEEDVLARVVSHG
jgi:chaperonin GroES